MSSLATSPTFIDRAVSGSSMLRLRVMEVHEQPAALSMWRELELRVASTPLMASESWTRTWLIHYGDTVRPRFLLAEDNGQLRGICLVTQSTERKAPWLTLQTRHLGTAGDPVGESVVVEYNSLLVEPAFRSAFIDAVSHWLLTQSNGDILQLDGFTLDESRELTAHWPAVETRERESKYLDLAAVRTAGGELIAALGRSTRSNLRRKLRDYGDLQIEWAESLTAADDILTELIELHQARWKSAGEPGAFASSRFHQFQRSLLLELFPQDRCVIFRVRHQGSTVGCLLLLVDRGRLLDYLSGFASFQEKPSPGLVTHYLCQCEALQRGYSAYDFLVGDKQHKENLSTHTQILAWTRLTRPTLKCRAVSTLTKIKRWLRPLPVTPVTPTSSHTAPANPSEQE